MSEKRKEESTEVIQKPSSRAVGTPPASAGLPGMDYSKPPPVPKDKDDNLPFEEATELTPEKKANPEEIVAALLAAMKNPEVAAALRGVPYTPPKPKKPPIDWKAFFQKWESAFRILTLLALFGLGSWKIPHLIATMFVVSLIIWPEVRAWWKKDDEKNEKKDEGEGTNWMAWVGLLLGAVLIAVIGFVGFQKVLSTETTKKAVTVTPAIIPQPEAKKKAATPLDKFRCVDMPAADLGLACCDKLAEVDRADCKDYVLTQMDNDGEGTH